MKLRPLADRLILKRLDSEDITKGGIIIPDSAKEKPMEGLVIAVGPGRRDEHGERMPLTVQANDKVLFSKYAGTEIKLDGEEHLVLREEDILAVITK